MKLTLTFHGAAGTVTGSCFRLSTGNGDVLIDCGLFQGTKTVRELNYRPFPFNPASLRAVLLTHAHIDHAGLVPKLVRQGYRGPVYATPATVDLLEYMLPDSGYIQETDVERLNRRNRQRGRPAVQPIYTEEDARASLKRLKPVGYDRWVDVIAGVRARFWQAGHLLGSASVELEVANHGRDPVRLLFSGDVGPGGKAFHEGAEAPVHPDWLVMETTYGDRNREELGHEQRRALLAAEVRAALEAGGPLLIPVFAVERTQELLYDLDRLFDTGVLPPVEVFLDSPLADAVTGVFRRHLAEIGSAGDDPFVRPNFHRVLSVAESQTLNALRGGAIIMAASGMCDAGRIRHHLKNHLWRPGTTVLLVGYQAPGTLGHTLRQGAPRVRIHGEEVEVRARIRSLDVYSGHADRDGLLDWLEARQGVGRGLFLVHGEPGAREAIRQALLAKGWDPASIRVPDLDETVDLTQPRPQTAGDGAPRLPAAAMGGADWHNRYAEALLELGEALRAAPDDRTRDHLLERVRKAIPQ
ncbi:MBL fold metallo-hydrolase [Azospirillum sp. TSO22-1]|uniref:MBL fold metallo-hydrolase RNA specificity domain-containing protein n=1 Tax=Azospirillum sp. TSO22-1 TaxID=716789 RepID=UPI000D6186C5|nr:MBL fold metallo-hydrolase [Azospirillum sp. TSO22-1]PWC43855.1 beta-lactamase [Azospirillum sp. TSO22-1]